MSASTCVCKHYVLTIRPHILNYSEGLRKTALLPKEPYERILFDPIQPGCGPSSSKKSMFKPPDNWAMAPEFVPRGSVAPNCKIFKAQIQINIFYEFLNGCATIFDSRLMISSLLWLGWYTLVTVPFDRAYASALGLGSPPDAPSYLSESKLFPSPCPL